MGGEWLQAGRLAPVLAALLCLAASLPSEARTVPPPTPAAPAPADRTDTLERHPLEIRALVEPEAVLQELAPALLSARLAGDQRQLALLHLAQANACRVVADWDCQREAGLEAQAAARDAKAPQLQVRGLIAESRARLAMQDYTRGERLLGEAERLLQDNPQPELLADVMLAYSSMSYSLGKHALAAEYAARGLDVLGPDEGLAMRARLLRNQARAQAQLGQVNEANLSLQAATRLSQRLNDPKLVAELYLEGARVARVVGDIDTQRSNGERVLELAGRLKNSQLAGLGHEVLGLAAADAGEGDTARRELRAAQDSFRRLELQSDELRVLRELVTVLLRYDPGGPELAPLFQRFLVLDNAIAQNERSQAADDFDARLKYAERENEILRLEGESALAREREQALARSNRLGGFLIALGMAMMAVLAVFFVAQRRSNRKLTAVLARLVESEAQYRTLADNSSDLVVRMALDGRRRYVSPSAREMLGVEPEVLMVSESELVHPEDRARWEQALAKVGAEGGSATVRYRARHANGQYVWIEALARRALAPDGSREVVYAGRDIGMRVRAEQAVEAIQSRLRAVTDNIPALISHIDSQERYTFVNTHGSQFFGTDPDDMIGQTVREVRGEALYSELKQHIAAVLAGRRVTFEGQAVVGGRAFHHQTTYVPDIGADGVQRGFFAFTFDITRLKDAEHRLEHIARFDSLTGVANRRYFDERLSASIARCQRQSAPVALLYLDIDRFKQVNDQYGHAAGDAVLREFAARLKACVREGDLAARIGGDEFVLLAEGTHTADDARALADKLIRVMARPMDVDGRSLAVGASIGVAFSRGAGAAERLLASADEALYAAKDAGRGTWRMVELD